MNFEERIARQIYNSLLQVSNGYISAMPIKYLKGLFLKKEDIPGFLSQVVQTSLLAGVNKSFSYLKIDNKELTIVGVGCQLLKKFDNCLLSSIDFKLEPVGPTVDIKNGGPLETKKYNDYIDLNYSFIEPDDYGDRYIDLEFYCPFILEKSIDKIFKEINNLYSGSYEDYKEKSKTFKDFLKLLWI